MARANPHLRAHDLLVIDADIAHIRLAIEREFYSRFPQPVLPRFYWRERLRVLVRGLASQVAEIRVSAGFRLFF